MFLYVINDCGAKDALAASRRAVKPYQRIRGCEPILEVGPVCEPFSGARLVFSVDYSVSAIPVCNEFGLGLCARKKRDGV